MDKKELRKQLKHKRDLLSLEEIENNSTIIFERLLRDTPFITKKCVLSYVDYKNEVKTGRLINYCFNSDTRIATPKVNNSVMDFYYIHSFDDLKPGTYGILEPDTEQICIPDQNTVILMPGLAFDLNGGRVGYGGGYYDRYLNKYPDILKIAVCFDFQIVDQIDCEETDIKPDYIVTEKKIYKIS